MLYEVGQWVQVQEDLDDIGMECHACRIDDEGQVVQVVYNHGCGEICDGIDDECTDPMYVVLFRDGGTGSFFREELMGVTPPSRRSE